MQLNIRIRQARRDAGLSQKALAEITGVGRSAVAQWERNGGSNPSAERLAKIAIATKVSHEWLTTGRGARQVGGNGEVHAHLGLMLDQYAQCELEERMLRAFRELRTRDQMAHVDFLEALTGRSKGKSEESGWPEG